jgi:serine/threonine protein kinase
MEQYEKLKKIGRGTYGDVLVVKRKADGMHLALKKVAIESLPNSSTSDSVADLNRESSISNFSNGNESKRKPRD